MKKTVSIPGIHCNACVMLIKDVSSEFPTIKSVDVDLNSKQIVLEHEEGFDFKQWAEEIEALDEKYQIHSIN